MNRYTRLAVLVLCTAALMTTACSKTIMQQQEPVERTPVEETEPVAVAPEPEPEPEPMPIAYDTSEKDRARFLHEHIYFDFDSAALKPDSRQRLGLKAQWLLDNPDVIAVLIEGHCDSRGPEAYNVALGDRRAQAVKRYLIEQGIADAKLSTKSLGESMPLDNRQNEEAWAKNRRVSFVIN